MPPPPLGVVEASSPKGLVHFSMITRNADRDGDLFAVGIAQRVREDRPDQAEVFCGEIAPAVADGVGRGGGALHSFFSSSLSFQGRKRSSASPVRVDRRCGRRR